MSSLPVGPRAAAGICLSLSAVCFVAYRDLLLEGVVAPTLMRYALGLLNPMSWLAAMQRCEARCDFTLAPGCLLRCLEIDLIKSLVAAADAVDPSFVSSLCGGVVHQ